MKRFYRLLMMLALLVMLAACGGGAPEAGSGDEGGEGAAVEEPAEDAVVITMDSAKEAVNMKIGQTAAVKLDPAYEWSLAVTPALVADADKEFTPTEDTQAQITAKLAGSAVIQATGKPKCAADNPPCDTPRSQLNIKLKVTP